MHEHFTEASPAPDQPTTHVGHLTWINRIIGTIVMFIACLAFCHFAGLIHLNLG